MLTKIEVKQTIRITHALAQILSSRVFTLRQCNARGCEYGRRETLVQCCCNTGPPSLMAAIGLASRGRVPRLRLFLMMIDCYTLPSFLNQ